MTISNAARVQDMAHHVHGQTNLREHAEQGPVMITRGEGIYIWDDRDRRLIDGISGLGCTALGYSNTRLAEAAKRQLDRLPYTPTFYNRSSLPAAELSHKLTSIAPVPMDRVLFQCSGSEANDTAIKLIWYANTAKGEPKRRKIIGRLRGYHGNTVATVSLSGQPHMHAKFGLPLPEFKHTELPNYYRFHIEGESEEEFSARMAAAFDQLIEDEDPDSVAAFFAEPVQGGGGALVPPAGYWAAMQQVIKKHGLLFLVDEVISGFGRTGNLWASTTFDLKPDLLTCAKALTSAYIPMSALMFKNDLYLEMLKNNDEVGVFGHGYTYAGHPVAAAVALETLKIYEEMDIVAHVRDAGAWFQDQLKALEDHPLVGEVRGVGLFCGIELVKDRRSREFWDPAWKVGEMVMHAAHKRGLYMRAIGDRLQLMPPLIISKSEIDELVSIFKSALDDAWLQVSKRGS